MDRGFMEIVCGRSYRRPPLFRCAIVYSFVHLAVSHLRPSTLASRPPTTRRGVAYWPLWARVLSAYFLSFPLGPLALSSTVDYRDSRPGRGGLMQAADLGKERLSPKATQFFAKKEQGINTAFMSTIVVTCRGMKAGREDEDSADLSPASAHILGFSVDHQLSTFRARLPSLYTILSSSGLTAVPSSAYSSLGAYAHRATPLHSAPPLTLGCRSCPTYVRIALSLLGTWSRRKISAMCWSQVVGSSSSSR